MILSASRRTDIPRYYLDWLLNRLREGYVLVRNPMNYRQISRVPLAHDVLDCIAFWSKNPAPMLSRLKELEPYSYYVQFTINPYGKDVESDLPDKDELIGTFRSLAAAIGPERVVWRYSPVLLSRQYTMDNHLRCFEEFARRLRGYTNACRLSFLDIYRKIAPRMEKMGIVDVPEADKTSLAGCFAEIAAAHGIALGACGKLDLSAAGIAPAGCIDAALASRVAGFPLSLPRDTGQRNGCCCAQSVDIGAYNTCANGCVYCYANISDRSAGQRCRGYDPDSPILCDTITAQDTITVRAVKSHRERQTLLFT